MSRMSDEQLAVPEVAARLGLAVATVRAYRLEGRLPEPDGMVGRTPWWRPETIDAWQAARPGRGRAGIPRKPR
nr:MAG TPA: Pyocin activator protein PrtN [Caudoviricetes sp.]